MVLAALLIVPCRAQDAAPPALDVGFNQSLQAFDAGRIDEAIDLLEGVFEENPAYVLVGQGGAAYWLGRAYQADDDPESTREVWKEGLEALDEASLFDPRLADAFARMTFAERHGMEMAPPPAETAFGALLGHITGGGDAATFQPMNVNFGLFPPLEARGRRKERRRAMGLRALSALDGWLHRCGQAAA